LVKDNGWCENEQLSPFVPDVGKRGDRLIAALFEAGRIAAMSADVLAAPWPWQEGNSTGGARFTPCSHERRRGYDPARDLKQTAQKLTGWQRPTVKQLPHCRKVTRVFNRAVTGTAA
jgi:hypothetical protein